MDGTWIPQSFRCSEQFCKTAVPGAGNVFHRLMTDGAGTIQTTFSPDADDTNTTSSTGTLDVYFYVPTSSENLTATITAADGTITTKSYSSTNQHYICHVGDVTDGSTIAVSANDGSAISGLYAYAFDLDTFKEVYNTLNA